MGQTKNSLRERFGNHYTHIGKKKLQYPLGYHFNTNGHKGLQDVEIHILDFIFQPPDSPTAEHLRDNIEHHWMHKLRSIAPKGLNTID